MGQLLWLPLCDLEHQGPSETLSALQEKRWKNLFPKGNVPMGTKFFSYRPDPFPVGRQNHLWQRYIWKAFSSNIQTSQKPRNNDTYYNERQIVQSQITVPHGTHYENMPIQIYWKFQHQTNENFQIKKFWYFSYFCSKHRLWVLVRTASMRRF